MARGKLESTAENGGGYNLVQTNAFKCERLCDDDIESLEGNVTALWMVEKVRHRDPSRGHRYEMRITIMPIGSMQQRKERTSKEVVFEKRMGRSFILRDNDYPKYFRAPTAAKVYKKSDIDRTFTLDFGGGPKFQRQQYPFALNYRPELNVGEYYMRPPTIIPPNYMPQLQHNVYPGQFYQFQTPNYINFDHLKNYNSFTETTQPIRFPEVNTLLTNKITDLNNQGPLTTHLHHHYYLNKMKVPLIKATVVENQFLGDHRGVTELYRGEPYKYITPIAQNDLKTHQPDYNNYQTPQVFPNQIPAPNAFYKNHFSNHITHPQFQVINQNPTPTYNAHQQPVTSGQYSQPLQIPPNPLQTPQPFRQFHTETTPLKYRDEQPNHNQIIPFQESEKYDSNKFSDPDPLYHPSAQQAGSHYTETQSETNKKAQQDGFDVITTKVKPSANRYKNDEPRSQKPDSRYPDSINAQLPPPERGTDTSVPYVETSVVTQKSEGVIIIPSISPSAYDQTSSPSSPKQTADPRSSPATKTSDKIKTRAKNSNLRQHFRTTTEKPIIKWMPKRRRLQNPQTTNATKTVPSKLYSSRIPQFDSSKVENYITVQPLQPSTTRATTDLRIPTISTKLNMRFKKPNLHNRDPEEEQVIKIDSSETPTKKSFSSSISIETNDKLNNKRRLFDNLRPRLKLKSGTDNGDKLEMIKADIQTLKTNNTGMHLFRASDEMTDGDGDASSDPIAASILKHAKSITENNNRRIYRRQ